MIAALLRVIPENDTNDHHKEAGSSITQLVENNGLKVQIALLVSFVSPMATAFGPTATMGVTARNAAM